MSCAPAPEATSCVHAPAEPGELTLSSTFACARLHAPVMPIRTCLLRQSAAARGRTTQRCRGQGTLFPSCDGCGQGRAVRAAVEDAAAVRWEGAGPGHRFERPRTGSYNAQKAARRRLQLVGALDIPPSIDEPPPEPDEIG